MDKKLYEIQIPKTANIGDVKAFNLEHDQLGNFTKEHHEIFLQYILGYTNGYSVLPEIKGVWVGGQETYREKMIPVRIACSEFDIEKIAGFAKKHYKQDAIFVAELGTARFF